MIYRSVALAGALVPFVLALLGLVAWTTGQLQLASFRAAYIPMAPSTAIGFVLTSTAVIGAVLDAGRLRRLSPRQELIDVESRNRRNRCDERCS